MPGVRDLLYDIKDSLDEAEMYGQDTIQRTHVHRRLNAIIKLIWYSLKDLEAAQVDANQNKDVLFDYLVKRNGRESMGSESSLEEAKEIRLEKEQ